MSTVTALSKSTPILPSYDGPIFDGDTHIHEPDFSFFKKYLPEKYHKDWLIEIREGDQGPGLYIGSHVVPQTLGETRMDGMMPPPGKLKEWLAAIASGGEVQGRVKPTPDMYERDARIKKFDEFGVDGSVIFVGQMVATLGVLDLMAEELGAEGACAALHAYNEYMLEAFGYNTENKLYPAPLLALWDLDWAVKEAKWIAENGGRIVCMPMGPAHNHAPASSAFDPLWRVLNDNEIVLAFHVSEATVMHPVIRAYGEEPMQPRRKGQTAWQWMFAYSEIPVMMAMASFILLNFFERFPKMKMVSVENGAEWLPRFLYKMDKMRGMARSGYWPEGQLKERPSTIFKRHCFVVAYPEDDIKKIVDEMGTADCILMGSDYPHAEGVPTPADFIQEGCIGLTDEQLRAIMHDNGRRMIPKR